MLTENPHLRLDGMTAELSVYPKSIRTDCLGMTCVVATLMPAFSSKSNRIKIGEDKLERLNTIEQPPCSHDVFSL